MKPISSAHILGELEREYLRLTEIHPQKTQPENFRLFIDDVYSRFRDVMASRGNIESAKEMKLLCKDLDTELTEIVSAHNALPKFVTIVNKLRTSVRSRLETLAGWKTEPPIKRGRPTETGLKGLNTLRAEIGASLLHLNGNEYLTAEELRASLAIAKMLGEVAVADFWSAVESERFSFNNHTIQNLRTWLGDVQTYSGNIIGDIPVQLLTLPSLRNLRDLLFAALRDDFYRKYYKDSLQGVDPVITALTDIQSTLNETAREQFVVELIDYFIRVENQKLPSRLRPGLGQGDEFPAKHQKIAIEEIVRQRQLLLGDPTGGGKTGSCIAAFEHLRDEGKAKRMLVLCPSSIVSEWEKRLMDTNGGYFVEGQKPSVVIIRSNDKNREAAWQKAKDADYVIMSLSMTLEGTAGKNHVDRAREIGADFLVVDEAHNARNISGQITESIFQISQCESIRNGFTVAATATPVYNTVQDIAAQIRLLNAGQDRVHNTEGLPHNIDFNDIKQLTKAISHNHTRLVRNLLKLRMLRRNANDCLPVGTRLIELPHIETPLSLLEQEIYDAIHDDPFYEPAQKIHALQRACTYSNRESDDRYIVGQTKLRQIMDAVLERVAVWRDNPQIHSGKIVLAVPKMIDAKGVTRDFNGMNDPIVSESDEYLIGRLRTELALHGIETMILDGANTGSSALHDGDAVIYDIDGATMTKTRAVRAKFRDHTGPALLVLRTDTGGEGIDWSFSDELLYLAPTSVQSEVDQQNGRLYRKGQTRDVSVQMLMISNSIERGKWEFAQRKQRIIQDLLDGRPLTSEEIEILHEENQKVRRGGFLAYEARTPRQKITFLFNRMFCQGKERVREILAADGGRYAQELATLYRQVEDLGTQGNNRRLLLGVLQKHLPELQQQFGNAIEIADIAAGTLGMARHLAHVPGCTVYSSDISSHMLEAGRASLTAEGIIEQHVNECSMDALPYDNESKHIAIHSLALDCTKHTSHALNRGGGERIESLLEVNRILAPGGLAIIGLNESLFRSEDSFVSFHTALETHFGFEVIEGDTGLAISADHGDEEEFKGYVITLRKVRPSVVTTATLPQDAWLALQFFKGAPRIAARKERFRRIPGTHTPPPGAYHEEFTIGNQHISYTTPPEQLAEKSLHQKRKHRYTRVAENIERLVGIHGSFQNIPAEELLSISLGEITATSQSIRDRYFRELLKQYDGRIDRIPLDQISRESPVILVKRYAKKKGWYLVLATVDAATKKEGTYGKRYFAEEEFTSTAKKAI